MIPILGRIISCEVDPPYQPLISQFVNLDGYVLPKLHPANDPVTPPRSPLVSQGRGGLERQVQAAYILEELLNIINNADNEDWLRSLLRLDVKLQSFLGVVMDQCDGTWGLYCGSISVTIRYVCLLLSSSIAFKSEINRALFTLHWYILNKVHSEAAFQGLQEGSSAALDTITKIMVDIAHSHNKNVTYSNIDALPPTSLYILLASLHNLNQSSGQHDNRWRRDFEALNDMTAHFKRRWDNGRHVN